jgi:hypothetical protein
MQVLLHYGAPDLVTATFVQKNSQAEKFIFSYLSGKNIPFSKLIKTTRPIFIYFKTDEDKKIQKPGFGHLLLYLDSSSGEGQAVTNACTVMNKQSPLIKMEIL